MGLQPPEPMLMLTQGAQTTNVEDDEKQEVVVPIEEGGANLSQKLDNLSPLKVNKKKASYVTRGNNKRKASSSKTQVSKKKGQSQGRNPESVDVQATKLREASEALIDHEQEDPPKDKDVFTSINTFVINTLIASSYGLNVAALDEDDNKKIGEELHHANLFIVHLSPYSFVCQVHDLVEKTSD